MKYRPQKEHLFPGPAAAGHDTARPEFAFLYHFEQKIPFNHRITPVIS